MILELKPEQQEVLDRAAQSGMSPEEVLDQAFAVIREQYRNQDWMLTDREVIAAQIAEGFSQAERGELVDPEEAMRILRDRRTKRQMEMCGNTGQDAVTLASNQPRPASNN